MQLQMPPPAQQIILLAQQEYLALLGLLIHSQGLNKINFRGGSWGRVQEVHTPPPLPDLRLSNTTGTMHDRLSAASRISAVPLPKKFDTQCSQISTAALIWVFTNYHPTFVRALAIKRSKPYRLGNRTSSNS